MAITIPVNEVDQYGLILDRPAHTLPFNAWTGAKNIRFREGAAEKFTGEEVVMGTPVLAPQWLMPVQSTTAFWWVYANNTRVGATDGASHFDISRVGEAYTGNSDDSWTGTVFNGIPVLTNGSDVPQYWPSVSGLSRLQALPAWPAGVSCRSLKAYLSFLVALDVTESGTRYPQLVRWSQPAEVGAVPSTWDYTDTTSDAGRRMLGDSSDFILDGVALGTTFIIYRENSIWKMQYTGGQEIFDTRPMTDSAGMLAKACAVEFTKGLHAVFGDSDLLIHDGQTLRSIADERIRRAVFSSLDSVHYKKSFALHLRREKEVWFVYPESGSNRPNRVAVWNLERDRWGMRDFPFGLYASNGALDASSVPETWDSDSGIWDGDSSTWDERRASPIVRRPVIADAERARFLLAESSASFAATPMEVVLEREGLPLPISGRVEAPPDFTTWKQFLNVWPQIEGTVGTQVQVQVGTQADVNSDTVWQAPKPFTIGTTSKIDCFGAAGRLLSIRFTSNVANSWKLKSYEVELQPRGKF